MAMPVNPWIRVIDEDTPDMDPGLAEMYDEMRDPKGHVDNILKIHSLHPESLRIHFDFYKLVMHGRSKLSLIQREMIAVAVSTANECHY